MRKNSHRQARCFPRWVIAVLWIAAAFPAGAEQLGGGDDPEKTFRQALESYRQADYYRALVGFRQLLRDDPAHKRITAALIMQAKCYYWLQNYDQSVESLQVLLEKYKHSLYRDQAHYLLANCYWRQGHYWRSADQLRQVLASTEHQDLTDLARDGLRVIIADKLTIPQLTKLYDGLPGDAVSPWILVTMARQELAFGHKEEALAAVEQVLTRFPGSQAAVEAAALRGAAQEKIPQNLVIGVICPLSGPYATYGEELRNGVLLAVEKHNARSDIAVDLEVRNTQGQAVWAVQATRTLIEEENVVAVLGPLLSPCAVAAGAASDCRGVPLITPTASEEDVAEVGRFVFQRSVGARILGRKMAACAVDDLELKTFAVLAPGDGYGQAAVQGFAQEASDRGARIVAVTWYRVGATDFKEQLVQIRRLIQAYEDSLMALGAEPASINPSPPDTMTFEEDNVHLDGIFIPAYPEEAGMIAPQIAFHQLHMQILGTSGWGSREAMNIGGQYLDGVIFSTDFFETLSSDQYQLFVAEYQSRFGHSPGKVGVFSYECTQLLLQGIEKGLHTPDGLRQYLANTDDFQGLTSSISFAGENGANDQAMILTIQNGRILRLR